jgi:exopolysaccharide/PEP-CTERM locus tyrosine autokinase
MKIDRRPVPDRELSLIERAGEMWGFSDGLRAEGEEAFAPAPAATAPVTTPVRAEPVEALPFSFPEGRQKDSTSTSSVRTEVGTANAHEPTTVSSGLSFLVTDDRADAEEPLDLVTPALPEWAAPTGVAAIDRVMLAEKGMLVPGAPIGALAEEFRLVKRQLLLTAREVSNGPLGQRARTILVGSGKPGDGKTYCAVNLAISLAAERDVEILLVDADFAKPDVMRTLGLEDSVGFLDVIADPTLDPESCIVRTDVPQLSLLPAGQRTTADTELLASKRTEEVIDALLAASPKRMIVFDTPPTLAASPASVLALLIGQVMLVVRADRTTEADVREAVSLLDGCEHISLVLNAVSYQPGGGRFGSYYGQETSK